ncbi:hypothetical protein D3C85_931870 [compost metagenome]
MHFVGAVLGDGGEARVDVFHQAVTVHQQEGAGALLHGALEQVQGAGGVAALLVHQDLGELVGQFAGEGDLVRLPDPRGAGVFQAEHAHHLAADADAGVEHGGDALGLEIAADQLAGAWVALGIVRVDGAPAVQGFEVARVQGHVDCPRVFVVVLVAAEQADGHQLAALEHPDAGARDVVGFAGGLGDELCGFLGRIAGGVAMARQAHDQALLGAGADQVLQVVFLGALVELEGGAQAAVLGFQVEVLLLFPGLLRLAGHHQVAAQQFAAVLLERLADLQQAQGPIGGVQGVVDGVVGFFAQLQLHLVMQPVTAFRFHQAGVGGVDEGAELAGRHAEPALAGRVEEEQCPAGFVEPLETHQAQPRGDRQLRHYLGHRTAGGIGMALHRVLGFHFSGRERVRPTSSRHRARVHHDDGTGKHAAWAVSRGGSQPGQGEGLGVGRQASLRNEGADVGDRQKKPRLRGGVEVRAWRARE